MALRTSLRNRQEWRLFSTSRTIDAGPAGSAEITSPCLPVFEDVKVSGRESGNRHTLGFDRDLHHDVGTLGGLYPAVRLNRQSHPRNQDWHERQSALPEKLHLATSFRKQVAIDKPPSGGPVAQALRGLAPHWLASFPDPTRQNQPSRG